MHEPSREPPHRWSWLLALAGASTATLLRRQQL